MTLSLSDAMDAYQAQLEAVRCNLHRFDPEEQDELLEDLAKARDALEVAWLGRMVEVEAKPGGPEDRYGGNSPTIRP